MLTESAIFKHREKSNLANRGKGIPSNPIGITLQRLIEKIKQVLHVILFSECKVRKTFYKPTTITAQFLFPIRNL